MKKLIEEISKFIKKYKLHVLKDVAIFVIIILVVHFSYRAWVRYTDYWPISGAMHSLHDRASTLVFHQSVWIIDHVLGMAITTDENKVIYFQNNGYIGINESCSGVKPILQFVLLMLLFPGPWKHKAWFIPMGIVILHLTNLFRISGLAVVTITAPQYWDFAHDNLFRPFFYVVIFFLWVWWVEGFKNQPFKGYNP
jgi:exosortase/archaeosortase family protein